MVELLSVIFSAGVLQIAFLLRSKEISSRLPPLTVSLRASSFSGSAVVSSGMLFRFSSFSFCSSFDLFDWSLKTLPEAS